MLTELEILKLKLGMHEADSEDDLRNVVLSIKQNYIGSEAVIRAEIYP